MTHGALRAEFESASLKLNASLDHSFFLSPIIPWLRFIAFQFVFSSLVFSRRTLGLDGRSSYCSSSQLFFLSFALMLGYSIHKLFEYDVVRVDGYIHDGLIA